MKSNILVFLFFLNLVFFIPISAQAQWQPCQGLEGGSVGNIIQSDSFLFVSSSNNIYRTDTNFLSPWEKCYDSAGGTLLKVDSCIFSYKMMMCFIRSFDNGITWNPVESIGVPSTMCSIENNIFLDYYHNFIIRSDDYLDTFEIITSLPALESPKIWSHDSLLFVSDDILNVIYQSVDTGSSWDTITTNGLPNEPLWVYDMICFNNTIWFGGYFGVYFLNQDRTTWIEVNSALHDGILILDLYYWYDELYCCTWKNGLYKLNFTDTTWIQVENSPVNINSITDINNELYCSTSKGPYTMDTIGNWHTHFEGLYHRNILSLSELNDTIYVFANGELFISVDDGNNFEIISDVYGKQIISTDSVFYIISGADILISRDNALTWDTITVGLDISLNHLTITNDYYFVSSNNGLFRSRIDSIEWIELENGFSGGWVFQLEAIDSVVIVKDIDCISISKDCGNTFDTLFSIGNYSIVIKKINNRFYILKHNLILFSDDLGETWEEIQIDNPYCDLLCIDQNEDYFVVGGAGLESSPYLSISYDNGQTWTDIVDNLPSSDYTLIDNVKIHNERLFVSLGQNSLWYRDDILTNISENNYNKEKFDKIYLYPNPVKDVITLELSSTQENCQFRIFDIRGSVQIHGKFVGIKTEIYLGNLKAGIYIIEVTNVSEKINQKIIKY